MIATLRHRLIRVPARLVRHAGALELRLPPGHDLLDEVLAPIPSLPRDALIWPQRPPINTGTPLTRGDTRATRLSTTPKPERNDKHCTRKINTPATRGIGSDGVMRPGLEAARVRPIAGLVECRPNHASSSILSSSSTSPRARISPTKDIPRCCMTARDRTL